jgi:hypothetical protein
MVERDMSGQEMDDQVNDGEARPLSLWKAWGYYWAGFLIFFGPSFILLNQNRFWFIYRGMPVIYLVIGYLMNRLVLRRLIAWHPVHATIENVAKEKFASLFFWPITYPFLFFKLLVVKHF